MNIKIENNNARQILMFLDSLGYHWADGQRCSSEHEIKATEYDFDYIKVERDGVTRGHTYGTLDFVPFNNHTKATLRRKTT